MSFYWYLSDIYTIQSSKMLPVLCPAAVAACKDVNLWLPAAGWPAMAAADITLVKSMSACPGAAMATHMQTGLAILILQARMLRLFSLSGLLLPSNMP
jgi:hypothetical protein